MLLIHASVDIDDLFDTNSIAEEQEIDIHELLGRPPSNRIVWMSATS